MSRSSPSAAPSPSPPSPGAPRRRRPLLAWIGLGGAGLTLGLVAGLVLGRLALAPWALAQVPPLFGLPALSARVSVWDLDRLVVEDARLADGTLAWDRLELAWTWKDLATGRLSRLALTGPTLAVPAATSSEDEPGAFSLPLVVPALGVDDWTITNARVHLPGADASLTFSAHGHLTPEADAPGAKAPGANAPGAKAPGAKALVLTLEALDLNARVPALPDPVTVTLARPARLTLGPGRLDIDAAFSPSAPLTMLLGDQTPLTVRGLGVSVTGGYSAREDAPPLVLHAQADAVEVAGVHATDVDVDASLNGPTATFAARLVRLPGEDGTRTGGTRAPRALRLVGHLKAPDQPDTPTRRPLDLAVTLDAPGTPPVLAATGWIDAGTGAGELRLDETPVSLAPEALTLADLYPPLGTVVEKLTARLRPRGTVAWGDGWSLRADLALDRGQGRLGGLPIQDLSARLGADRPANARGLALRVQAARFTLADGTIETEGPVPVPLTGAPVRVPLAVRGVDLAALSAFLDLEEVSAAGRLDGRLPLVFADGPARVENGHLQASGPGHLRYRIGPAPSSADPAPPPSGNPGGVALLRRALENFQYKTLSLTLNGPLLGDLAVGVGIAGANPDVYDGYPIELSVTISGALADLILANLRTTSLPQRLQENAREVLRALGRSSGRD
ncbi:intermembrane phospholipid transport protein YdbH family protein [Pararhodospirillum oryzae]|uniref:Uncharacterized protein n=1 Tax=Pararhodospirillum oryzae TaxID=478448 RepID=A0A512H3V3_9PROT|nr:YdbH domain-containing protein [Pararhodospirillum oryzae]GEO80149.1 hypothetical protein ROR02_02800 [Pararhodospirillum oryzae]